MPLEEARDSYSNVGHDYRDQLQSSPSRKALLWFFGENSQGKPVLDIIVRIAMMTLVSYPGEKILQVNLLCSCASLIVPSSAYTVILKVIW